MPNTITLKRRIASIKNTRQITKAMQLVGASKLKRAEDAAEASRDYQEAAYRLLARLNNVKEVEQHPLFKKRPIKTVLYVVITSNSGLAGAYNSNVLKIVSEEVSRLNGSRVKVKAITIGNKGAQFIRRLNDVELVAHYPAFGDKPTENDIRPVLISILDNYREGSVDEVRVIYTEFLSTIKQTVLNLPLLPASLRDQETESTQVIMNFEPDTDTVIHQVATRLIEVQIWQALLESLASEQSMRMIAMKNATDNANDLIEDYKLEYNTARQAAITQEIAEITGGAEALAE